MRPIRTTVSALACGLLLVAGTAAPSAGGPSGARGAGSRDEAGPVTIRIATYNVKSSLTPEQAVADISKLAGTGVDVITLQEMGGGPRRAALRAALVDCETCVFDGYLPDTPGANSTPILWRSDRLELLGTGSRQVTKDTYVGPAGAGPNTLRARFVNYVKLREPATGRRIHVLNNHAVPSVQGKNGGRNPRMSARLGMYRKHIRGLRALVTELRPTGASVFVTGDFNVNYRRDRVVRDPLFPYANMHAVEARSSFEVLGETHRGTHVLNARNDTRLIDYVFTVRHKAVTLVDQRVLFGYRSDHRPLIVRAELAPRPA